MKLFAFSSILLLLFSAATVAQPAPAQQGNCDTCSSYRSKGTLDPTEVQAEVESKAGEKALRESDFVTAETSFRASIVDAPDGTAYLGLAEALAAQGKTAEAIQAYRLLFHPGDHVSFGGSYFMRAQMEYALLLNHVGQWREAVAVYEEALASVPDKASTNIGIRFDPAFPQPVALAAATHIALGLDANWRCDALGKLEHDRAFSEYTKALQLEPNWDVANYYYGYGWQRLDSKSRARLGSVQQAKAALQKAILLGKSDVKKAARKALKDLKKSA